MRLSQVLNKMKCVTLLAYSKITELLFELYILIKWEKSGQIMTKFDFPFSSVTQSCPTLCDPMDCSMPRLPVHYQLPELTQTYIHQVGDAIQPFHPLSSPFPPAFNFSQHQGLSQRVSSSHQVNKVLEFQL